MKRSLLLASIVLAGCATDPDVKRDRYVWLGGLVPKAVHVDVTHVSHLTAGWPIEAQKNSEDGLTTLNLSLEWRPTANTYIVVGEGWNLQGRNGGGFYGPAEVFTARIGHTFTIRR